MQCPVCDVTLQIAERQGIEIDYCPQCRGVWLDRGELDKIIERANNSIPQQGNPSSYNAYPEKRKNDYSGDDYTEPRDYQDRERRETRDDRRRKQSFLDELFDIFD